MLNIKEFKKNYLFLILSILIIIVGFVISAIFTSDSLLLDEKDLENSGNIETNKILITEVMTSNKGAFTDLEGNNYDWLEIYNGKDHEINLKNYALSDTKKTVKWVFPETYVEAHSYVVVFLAGANKEGLYTNFKLKSSGGEDVVLINPAGKIIDGLQTTSLNKNEVMYRDNSGEWQRSKSATPGYVNTKEGLAEYEKSLVKLEEDLIITEVMPRNKGNFISKNGIYTGYIELTNNTDKTIDLSVYSVGSSLERPFEYNLPAYNLKSGESIAIFTSGKDEIVNDEIHASFKLDAQTGIAVLTKGNKIVSQVKYENLANGMALIKINDDYEVNNTISPGYANNEKGINSFSKAYLAKNKTLIINEVMNYNTSYLPHNGSSYYDWIEIYNNSNSDIDLSEYYLTTNTDNMTKWQFPKVTLKKGEYYVVMASGDEKLTTTKYKHANFKISETESIYLTKENKIMDSIFVANVPMNYSFGRGDYGFYYYSKATPLKVNDSGKREISYIPLSSTTPGIYDDVDSIDITLSSHGTIYYTLDGSTPTTKSKVYKGPLSLRKTTVLKTMSQEQGKYASSVQTYTYIINENHKFDVFMVSMDPNDFSKMQHNPDSMDYEKAAYAEFFEQDGNSFQVPCAIKLFGGSTRFHAKKSYALKFKSKYGAGKLNYQVFDNRDYSSYDSLVLRSGSQDYENAFMRDVLMTSLLDGKTSVLVQAYRPVVLYINGKYYGIYNLRERIDDAFISNRQNVPKDSSNIIKIDREVRSGTIASYDKLLNYLETHNMALSTNYEYIKTQVNVQDIADFWIAETWTTNHDIVNTRYYQNAYFDNNRWHAIMFDMDFAMYNVNHNYFAFSTSASGMTSRGYSTTILRNLLKNKEFRALYLERIGYQLENVWNSERVLKYIDDLYKLYYPEMTRNQKRWGLSMSNWENEVEKLRTYAKKRGKVMMSQAKSFFKMTNAEVERYFGDL